MLAASSFGTLNAREPFFINLSKFAKGMYYPELKGEAMNERKQFVKQ
jgi:hypothetical protein